MTIRRMHIACWITKSTNTHSNCVILTAFPVQHWLCEGVSILHCTTLYYIVLHCTTLYYTVLHCPCCNYTEGSHNTDEICEILCMDLQQSLCCVWSALRDAWPRDVGTGEAADPHGGRHATDSLAVCLSAPVWLWWQLVRCNPFSFCRNLEGKRTKTLVRPPPPICSL